MRYCGFTDSQGSFFVYDKRADSIFSTSPDAAFFENDLNTVVLPDGSNSDFLEKLYTHMETEFWPCLDRIRESTPNTPIALSDKMDLYLFLLFLHWRLPSNIEFVEELSKKFFRGENDLDYSKLESTTGDTAPDEVIEQLTRSSAFKKSAKLLVPFAPFYKDMNWERKLDDWRFLYSGDEKNWFMVGDNPIITHGYNDHDPVKCLDEFIFPVSGKILLLNGNLHKREAFPPEFTIQYNAAIIERA